MRSPRFRSVALLLVAFSVANSALAQKNVNLSRKWGSVVSGGTGNTIPAFVLNGTIAGGAYNTSSSYYATVGGGLANTVSSNYATVSGGWKNTAGGNTATVSGGRDNTASGLGATVGGGGQNTASGLGATVGGGAGNTASQAGATVGGGYTNTTSGDGATIGGGAGNFASGRVAAVSGGRINAATGADSAISGGFTNTASATASTVGGGAGNTASGEFSAVGGGTVNVASGDFSTVPGGIGARATHVGSFVWSGDGKPDNYDGEYTDSFGPYTFTVRAEGGVRFYTATGTSTGVQLVAGSGTWTSLSDRNAKENFKDVDPSEVLAKVAAMPIKTWNYKTQPDDIRHIGPMAQDFKETFGIGESDTGITTVDADGVALAAIQGLVEELKERDVQHCKDLAARDQTIEELKAKNGELSHSIEVINERLNSLPSAR